MPYSMRGTVISQKRESCYKQAIHMIEKDVLYLKPLCFKSMFLHILFKDSTISSN